MGGDFIFSHLATTARYGRFAMKHRRRECVCPSEHKNAIRGQMTAFLAVLCFTQKIYTKQRRTVSDALLLCSYGRRLYFRTVRKLKAERVHPTEGGGDLF
jgi:hypothetical protein